MPSVLHNVRLPLPDNSWPAAPVRSRRESRIQQPEREDRGEWETRKTVMAHTLHFHFHIKSIQSPPTLSPRAHPCTQSGQGTVPQPCSVLPPAPALREHQLRPVAVRRLPPPPRHLHRAAAATRVRLRLGWRRLSTVGLLELRSEGPVSRRPHTRLLLACLKSLCVCLSIRLAVWLATCVWLPVPARLQEPQKYRICNHNGSIHHAF